MKQKTVGIIANRERPAVIKVLESLAAFLAERKVRILAENNILAVCSRCNPKTGGADEQGVVRGADLVVVLGGDGTLLRAARFAAPAAKPLLGINLGTLGYITPFPVGDLLKSVDLALKGRLRSDPRVMLSAQIIRHNKVQAPRLLALNDIVIAKTATGRIVELKTYIDGDYLTSYRSDGLIVATPTGSTAYALAVGGPILHAGQKNLVLTPIAPHTLSNRPLVLPDASIIEVVVPQGRQPLLVTADGQNDVKLKAGDRIIIQKARETTRLLIPESFNYWEILRTKLGWRG